jgi:hypothetical protein
MRNDKIEWDFGAIFAMTITVGLLTAMTLSLTGHIGWASGGEFASYLN